MSKKDWKSVATWPKGTKAPLESTDTHHTQEDPRNVCRMLTSDGYGGEGKIFPISATVMYIGDN